MLGWINSGLKFPILTRNGATVADANGTALSTILKSVSDLAIIVHELSQAGQEQASGLAQINQAINQLDSATQANASSAEETSSSAESLAVQSENLSRAVSTLQLVVVGQQLRVPEKNQAA